MKLKLNKGGYIINEETNLPIAVLMDEITQQECDALVYGAELIEKVREFCESAKIGKYKPVTTIKSFEQILEKISV